MSCLFSGLWGSARRKLSALIFSCLNTLLLVLTGESAFWPGLFLIDRTTQDSSFQSAMVKAWNADPNTLFRPIVRNCYVVEFTNEEDLQHVMLTGPWSFRGDLVVFKKVDSQTDLTPEHISHATIWVQLYNLPPNSLTKEGMILVGQAAGKVVSPPMEGMVSGRHFVKFKILVLIGEPLHDRIRIELPGIGEIRAYCSYEKVNRICNFCGRLGHEIASCVDHVRLTEVLLKPENQGQFSDVELLEPKMGAWMVNSALIPSSYPKV